MDRPRFPFVLAALALGFGSLPSQAATLSWVNVAGGSAATAANWSPAQVPTASDGLVFNLTGSRTISWNSTVASSLSHTYRTGTTTLQCTSPHFVSNGIVLGPISGDVPSVSLTTGSLVSGGTSTIGSVAGAGGQLSVAGANVLFQIQNAGADFVIGGSGTGTTLVNNGGIVRIADDIFLGANSGGAGTLTVSGVGALNASTVQTFDPNGDILVGSVGFGTLNVNTGAVVEPGDDIIVAPVAGSNGSIALGVSNATLDVPDLCLVASNSTVAAAGTGTIDVNGGGVLEVGTELRCGDPDGGTGTFHLNGGLAHLHGLTLDTAHGVLDIDGGTLRIDGGAGNLDASVSTVGSNVSSVHFEFVRGATVTRSGGWVLLGSGGRAVDLLLDSGATFNLGGTFTLTSGTTAVTIDSSASFTTGGNFALGGSGALTNLNMDHGGVLNCVTFESADEAGGNAQIHLSGTNTRINHSGVLYMSGDAGHAGGVSTWFVGDGAAIQGQNASSNVLLYPQANLLLLSGGLLNTPGAATCQGALTMSGGTGTATSWTLEGNGIIRGFGTVNGRVLSTEATTRVLANGGDLVVGTSSSTTGFDIRGTIESGPNAVNLRDSNGITLGDSVLINGGKVSAFVNLTNPSGSFVVARGAIEAPTFINSGSVEVFGPTPGKIGLSNNFTQTSTGILRLRILGTDSGEADGINVPGTATLGGTLQLVFDVPNHTYTPGVAIPILNCATRVGTFPTIFLTGVDQSRVSVTYSATGAFVTFVSPVDVEPVLPRELAFTSRNGIAPWLELALPDAADVRVGLFDVRGRELALLEDRHLEAGLHRYSLPPGTAHGVYFARADIAGSRVLRARILRY